MCETLPLIGVCRSGLIAVDLRILVLDVSKQAVMLGHPQIVVSSFDREANCRETPTSLREFAVAFCSIQCIQHGAPPLLKRAHLLCYVPYEGVAMGPYQGEA